MTDTYTGRAQDKRYTGEDVDITYSTKRCIHAARCTANLSTVFDIKKRPWINPDGDSADNIAETITLCPSGALHFERKDGGASEPTPEINRIIVQKDGYIQLIGDLEINGASTAVENETRATLCRCGQSTNKPFCDNTHKEIDFETADLDVVKVADDAEQGGKLIVTATENGPYKVEGNFQIEDEDGKIIFNGDKTWLCRCGGSSKKPFCDGTHNKNSFKAE